MKNRIISGSTAIILGMLISLGPQVLFKLCPPKAEGGWMQCHWTGQAEIGAGLLVVLLGGALLVFASIKVRLGLSIALCLSGILVLLFPSVLIGGCMMETMSCRKVAFPGIYLCGILTSATGAMNSLYLVRLSKKGGVCIP
ncbi:MAG: DUF4418 family protein [Treponema sp.]|jgi:hypothetical protein|nr:DUF4418 family protein [Treponema sp.]